MSYLIIQGLVRGVSKGAFPSCDFLSGTWDEISQQSQGSDAQLTIGMMANYSITQTEPSAAAKSATIVVDFALLDTSDNMGEYTENIIASADAYADQWLEALNTSANENGVQIGQVVRIPFFNKFNSRRSGLGLQISLNVVGCGPTYPDLSTFANEVSYRISPVDWSGYQPA